MEEGGTKLSRVFLKKSEISRKAVYLNKSLIFPEKCQEFDVSGWGVRFYFS